MRIVADNLVQALRRRRIGPKRTIAVAPCGIRKADTPQNIERCGESSMIGDSWRGTKGKLH